MRMIQTQKTHPVRRMGNDEILSPYIVIGEVRITFTVNLKGVWGI